MVHLVVSEYTPSITFGLNYVIQKLFCLRF